MARGRPRQARWRRVALAASALLVLVGAGCGGSGAARPLTVYAASSLREVMPKVDPAARFSFAGSDELATQIREGAPADVYVAANEKYPRDLNAAGLVETPVTFASNRLVLLVPAGNPAGISRIADIARPGTRLVIAGTGVPLGDYTRTMFANLTLAAALRNVVSEERDAKGVVAKVALGEADAGVAYATDAVAAGGRVRAIPIPASAQPRIGYQVAVVSATTNPRAARDFVAALTGAAGRDALSAAGFVVP